MNQMFFESKSQWKFDETVNRLADIIAANGWKLTYTHDLQATMKKNGFDVASVKVLELCNPKYAHKLLSDDQLRIYSNMMPCRISVYEKEDGNTYISRMNSPMLAAQIGGVVQEVMADAYNDAEKFIAQLAD